MSGRRSRRLGWSALPSAARHAIVDAVVGAYTTGRTRSPRPGRPFRAACWCSPIAGSAVSLWQRPGDWRSDLLWRASHDEATPSETLDDGTWLAEFRPSGNAGRHAKPLTIRVIDYEVDDGRATIGPYRLFTTLLDPVEAPAAELAFAYAQALGDRARLRRAEDSPARLQGGAAIEVPGTRRAGDLGPSVLPLRDPHADVRSRRPRPGGP